LVEIIEVPDFSGLGTEMAIIIDGYISDAQMATSN